MLDKNDPEFTINIIGDIAGRYDELMLLLEKMPKANLTIAVGDLVDRGPKSRQVLEWFYNNQDKAVAIYGNHEDMMVKYCENPDDWNNRSMWLYNGGTATLQSFKDKNGNISVPEELIDWLKQCPLWWSNDDLIISHAPINFSLKDLPDQYDKNNTHYFVWNRMAPRKRIDMMKFHIYGHNGEYKKHCDDIGDHAMCVDNSWHGELMGIHWPSKEIFKQNFLEKEKTDEEEFRQTETILNDDF